MLKLIFSTLVLCQLLTGCTVAGVLIDGTAYSKAGENYDADLAQSGPHTEPKTLIVDDDVNTLSFSELGFQIDRAVVGFIKDQIKPQTSNVCRRISRTIKECQEVTIEKPHVDKKISYANDYDEMISVRQ